MAITYLEGFDDGLYEKRATLSAAAVGSSWGKNGNGIQVGDAVSDYYFYPPLPATSEFTIGFHLKIVSGGSGYVIRFASGLQNGLAFRWDSINKSLGMTCTGGDYFSYWSANGSVDFDEWHHIEINMLPNGSGAGTLHWKLDGQTIVDATGVDFGYLADAIYFGGSVNVDHINLDNVYITDSSGTTNTDFLGEVEVVVLLPSGNGTTSNLTGSDGNSTDNYQLVDENPPVTTDYVGSATEGDLDTYAFGDITGTPTVKGLILSTYDAKNDAGTKFMRHIVRLSSTDYASSSFALSESWGLNETTYDVSPDTSSAWTYTEVNGAEFGQEVRNS